jgi:cyclohexyl-isocyanide hydratase
MLTYPDMTALDLIGPQQVFGYLPGANAELVSKSKDLVRSDTGITIQPSKTFADCADPVDLGFVGAAAMATERSTKTFTSDGIEMDGDWKPCEC